MRSMTRAAPMECVLAQPHGRRPGVCRLAYDRHVVPANALCTFHQADHEVYGPLFDVQFEHSGKFMRPGLLGATIIDPLQFSAEGLAVAIGAHIGVFRRKHTGKHARSEHRRSKTGAFFIGPIDDLDRRIGLEVVVVECPQHFERGEHAKRAVEFSPGWLSVQMRSHRDRREFRVLARTAREHAADFVDRNRAAKRLALGFEPISHLPVEIGQGETADAAFRRAANLCRVHQCGPQPPGVDLQIVQVQSSVANDWRYDFWLVNRGPVAFSHGGQWLTRPLRRYPNGGSKSRQWRNSRQLLTLETAMLSMMNRFVALGV